MNRQKIAQKWLLPLMLIVSMVGSGACFGKQPTFLLFQTASEGKLVKLHNNNYLLRLKKNVGSVHFIQVSPSQKPEVVPQAIALPQFFSLWRDKSKKHYFFDTPPTAVITTEMKDSGQIFIALVSNPGFDESELHYQITVLDDSEIVLGSLGRVTLFFDDIHWDPKALV